MEHYILTISNEIVTDEDKVLIINYLSKIIPSSLHYQYSLHFASQVAVLLKHTGIFSAVLTKSHNENVKWEGPIENLNVKNIISTKTDNIDSAELTSKNFTNQISASIHNLADQLPAFGTYKLDVLLGSDVLENLSVSEESLLAGVFYRLTRWHSAHFAIFIQNILSKERLNEWCEIVNAKILEKTSELNFGPTLWRGAIQLETSNVSEIISCKGFEIALDIVGNKDKLFIFKSLNKSSRHENTEHVVLSPKLHIMDKCSFASIPSYMISPMIFRLHLTNQNILNEDSSDFLNYLINKNEVALIARIAYTKTNEKIKDENFFCTNRWINAISSGCIEDADCFVSKFENYISFVITKFKHSDCIFAAPLQKFSSLKANFYFNVVNCKISSFSNAVINEQEENNELNKVIAEIPVINTTLLYIVIDKLNKLKIQFYTDGCLNSSFKLNSEILSFWEDVRKMSNDLEDEEPSSHLLFERIGQIDWPKRIYLLFKQIQSEEDKECVFPNALLGLGPKLPQHCVSFSPEDVKKYFLPSGEPRNMTNLESLHPLNNLNNFKSHYSDGVTHLKWPEISECIYHDLYYNSSYQAEEKEAVGNQMVKFYVKHETACSCNKQQLIQNFSIVITEKRSHSTRQCKNSSYRKSSVNESKESDFKENIVKDLITKKILSSSSSICSQNATRKEMTDEKNRAYKALNQTTVKRKVEIPIRCSPRKKNVVNYKYSSLHRNTKTSKNIKVSKSNELPDLLRKKLRNAVATALENNGINLNDAFFQPCGKRLFTICQAFVQDIPQKKGKTSEHLQRIADAHVKQVIEFEKQKKSKN